MTTYNAQNNSAHNNESCNASKDKETASTAAVMGENVHFQNNLQKTLDDGVADIIDQANRYKNNPAASQVGFVAEVDHCATYNVRSTLDRSANRAIREPNGTHGDYKIVDGQKGVLVEGEMKYYSTAEKTENAMRGYGDRQLVGPSDQTNDIKKIAAQKAAKNKVSDNPTRQQVGLEHEKVAQNASDCISDGRNSSTPRSRTEIKEIANDASQGKVGHSTVLPPMGESLKMATKSGAKSGAIASSVITGASSSISNTKAWMDGEKDGKEAIIDVTVDIGKSAVDGALKGAAGSAATAVATHVAAQTTSNIAKTVLRGSAPAAIAISAVEVGKHTIDLARGKIDGEEFAEKTFQTAATGAGAWAGAEAGAVLGTMLGGPVGGVIGGVLGGLGGALGIGRLFG